MAAQAQQAAKKKRLARRGSLLRDPSRLAIDAGDDEGGGDLFIDGADRILHVAKWTANGDEGAFAAKMETNWAQFEDAAPGWKWVVVARDGPRWFSAMLFGDDDAAVAYSDGVLGRSPALEHGSIVYDDAVPIRKKVARKNLPPGSLLWLYSVSTSSADKLFLAFEEALARQSQDSVFGFAVSKPFEQGTRLCFAAIFENAKELAAYRAGVLDPLLKTISVKAVAYDDVAQICGYNDAEPDGGCTVM